MKRWWRVGIGGLAAGAALTGAVGLLHLPVAAPLLRAISPASLCPVTRGTPAQIDRGHAIAAASIRATAQTPAPARPALGFALNRTLRADVMTWAAKHEVSCASISGNANLQKCTRVPAEAVGQPASLGALEEITFEFQTTGELVNVQTLRRHLSPRAAALAASHLEGNVAAIVGAPETVGGEATAEHLSNGALSSYVAVHPFTDYRATISATNLAGTGVMVREEYLSVL